MSNISPQQFENLFLQLMFSDVKVQETIIPFLKPEIFEKFENKEIITNLLVYHNKYGKFPSIPDLRMLIKNKDCYEHLTNTLNQPLDNQNKDFVKDQLEDFFKDKLLYNELFKTLEGLKKGDDGIKFSSSDRIREACSFSFDTSVGLDYFKSAEAIYNSLHETDNVVPTGLTTIDRLIKGGLHEKTLTLLMAECVDKNTKIKIRIKKRKNVLRNEWVYEEVSISNIKELLKEYIIEVESPDGYVEVENYIEKGKKQLWELKINGKSVFSSKNHLYETNNGWKPVKQLNKNIDRILCDDNKYHIFDICETNEIKDVVDIKVNHKNHRYYTNGVSSHNTNMGKSLIKCALATNFLLHNKNVLYITLEMSEGKVSERITSNLFDTDINDLISIPKDRFIKKFIDVTNKINNKLVIKEFPTRSLNSNRIRSLLKELYNKQKFIPDVMIVDYMGIMVPNTFNKSSNSNTELKVVSEELRGIAMEYGFPILSSVQTNRGGFGEIELDLTDIAESIGTTTTADIIFGVTQTPELRTAGQYNFILLKNRYGLNKITCSIGVDYSKMRLFDLENNDGEVSPSNKQSDILHGKVQTPQGTKSNVIVDESVVNLLKKTKSENRNKDRNDQFNKKKNDNDSFNIQM